MSVRKRSAKPFPVLRLMLSQARVNREACLQDSRNRGHNRFHAEASWLGTVIGARWKRRMEDRLEKKRRHR